MVGRFSDPMCLSCVWKESDPMNHMQRIASIAADKTPISAFLCVFCALLISACGSSQTRAQNVFKNGETFSATADNPDADKQLHAVATSPDTTTSGSVDIALVAQSQKPKDSSKSKSRDRDSKKQNP